MTDSVGTFDSSKTSESSGPEKAAITNLRPIADNIASTRLLDENLAKKILGDSVRFIQENIISEYEKLVDKIKVMAEQSYENRPYLDPNNVTCYIRAKHLNLIPPAQAPNDNQDSTTNCSLKYHLSMSEDPFFDNLYTNSNFSTVHVPTNVYDQSNELKITGNWTEKLDEVFRENRKKHKKIKWQYFGSPNGFLRIFPGVKWKIDLDIDSESTKNAIDFFDVRTQSWYLGAATYPKEVIIMVDKSGSMKGRRNIISNATVKELLLTLTENDLFNVYSFSDNQQKRQSEKDDTIFMPAYQANKDEIVYWQEHLNVTGVAKYETWIPSVLKDFHNLSNRGNEQNFKANAKCNKSRMIMVITDGSPEAYEQFWASNNTDRDVRVFTFLLDQQAVDEPQMKKMACLNRGYYVSIGNLADVKENVLRYLSVAARSNAINNDSFPHWTGCKVRDINVKSKFSKEELKIPELVKPDTVR
ncbi:Voltage-dependent calcium channel subunit alpha-2/delta-4 [Cichlidogyrus casuarinus]|uniref:Voltage-dependent calcium channel subunit alpha-2/delta-4 n=1 Tax=Cichlidogyrus casuarinus TaxID=1844966 RepID=A0ABD2Q0U7_9PLAT